MAGKVMQVREFTIRPCVDNARTYVSLSLHDRISTSLPTASPWGGLCLWVQHVAGRRAGSLDGGPMSAAPDHATPIRAEPGSDHTPPQNPEAEESVLGAILISPGAMAAVVEILRPSDFYRLGHGTIYKAAI